MFTGDTKNKTRSGAGMGSDWQNANRNAGAQQHTTAESVAAQDAAQNNRRRPMRTPVGGGGAFGDFWSSSVAYQAGSVVQVLTTTTYGGVTIFPGTYMLRQSLSTPASPTTNQIPQYPYPTAGTNNGLAVQPYVYWLCISMGINLVNTCSGGTSANIYLNSSGTF